MVDIDEKITGFIVDSVAKVLTVPAGRILPPPDIIVAGVQMSVHQRGVVHLLKKASWWCWISGRS